MADSIKSQEKVLKHITTIHLFEQTAFVPRSSREKLAKAERIQDLKVLSSMTGEDIEAMIMEKFVTEAKPLSITYYKTDKSDLVKIDPPQNAEELFESIGHGSLYIFILIVQRQWQLLLTIAQPQYQFLLTIA